MPVMGCHHRGPHYRHLSSPEREREREKRERDGLDLGPAGGVVAEGEVGEVYHVGGGGGEETVVVRDHQHRRALNVLLYYIILYYIILYYI